jgi:glutaconate CoA-transferase subunit A
MLDVAPDLEETEPPNEGELQLLREQIDPLGIRRLEFLGGAKRRSMMRTILEEEEIANRRK